ncbi:GGDEF domain-containing protein [Actinoplanes sp. NBRC 103695]|uniref:GGDEF domain-containing protein n=1 Tax=Actinoplanes sp. NBRC 103695 TaxID=3032202 RepID=UPI0025529FA9|nr:GGDEF domain-containing protein [Actinoplanes sp. NBRC 103695]
MAAFVISSLTGAPGIVGNVLGQTALIVGLVAIVSGMRRHRLASACPWLLVAATLLVLVAGLMPPGVLAGTASPPSIADVFYLSSYAAGGLGLLLTIRRRTPDWGLPGLLDSGIVTVSAGLLTWIYLIDPILSAADIGVAPRLVAAAYPLCDLMLAGLGARLLLDGGPKSVAVLSITGYLALTIIPDTLNTLDALAGQTRWTVLVSLLWMISGLVLGLAWVHPSVRDLYASRAVENLDLGPARLSVLMVATLLAPAAQFLQYVRGAQTYVPLICVSCAVMFVLVIARLGGVVAVQRRMVVTDMLTGLHSRRYFESASARLPRRSDRAVAVLMLDIDHFKKINDTYGHDGGDRVLREIARRLSQSVRPGDVLARYGGEEFVVLMPDTLPRDARLVAERVREAVCSRPVDVNDDVDIIVTVSVGVACRPDDVAEADHLTPFADRMLYSAKESGRNRVVTASDQVPVDASVG